MIHFTCIHINAIVADLKPSFIQYEIHMIVIHYNPSSQFIFSIVTKSSLIFYVLNIDSRLNSVQTFNIILWDWSNSQGIARVQHQILTAVHFIVKLDCSMGPSNALSANNQTVALAILTRLHILYPGLIAIFDWTNTNKKVK